MNILIACNDKYLNLAKYMLYSLSLYNKDLNIYMIHENLSNDSIDTFRSFILKYNVGKLNVIKFDSSKILLPLKNDEITGHITKEAYFRLYAPFFLPVDLDKILYLDCDIICTSNIDDFYNLEFDGNVLLGCVNIDIDNESYNKRLGLPVDNTYINSGVLLFNLNLYKEKVSIDSLNKFILDNFFILDYQDQDVVNKMFHGYIGLIPIDYNFQISLLLYAEGGKLIHYTGMKKPWYDDYDMPAYAIPYYDVLKEIGEFDILKHNKKNHLANFQLRLKKCLVVVDGNITEFGIRNMLRQNEKDLNFIVLCDEIDLNLLNKYSFDCRLQFVRKSDFDISNFNGIFISYLNIDKFADMDFDFFRELIYFGRDRSLAVVFYKFCFLSCNTNIINLEKQLSYFDMTRLIRDNVDYNCMFRRVLDESNSKSIGYWE